MRGIERLQDALKTEQATDLRQYQKQMSETLCNRKPEPSHRSPPTWARRSMPSGAGRGCGKNRASGAICAGLLVPYPAVPLQKYTTLLPGPVLLAVAPSFPSPSPEENLLGAPHAKQRRGADKPRLKNR